MRTITFLIFFIIVLTIYGAVNYYLFIRGWQSIPPASSIRTFYLSIFLLLSLSFIVGRVFEKITISWVSDVFVWIGSFWLAMMLYFFLAVVILDFLRMINFFLPFFPQFITNNYEKTKQVVGMVVVGSVFIAIAIGYFNSLNFKIVKLNLSIHKKVNSPKMLNVVVTSDIHLGTIIGNSHLEKIVEGINGLNPDIVLLPGDIVDEDLAPVIKQNLGEKLKNIQSKYGVYAVIGNHEYIGGVEKACKYLVEHNINLLRDSAVKIGNSFYIIGREDRSKNTFTGKKRKPLEELMSDVNKEFPVFLMDHQPFDLNAAENSGVDLQLSGHTHHGQLWPLNFITNMVYEISRGYKQERGSHFYVSCGVGTWGPPVRLGNRPEIVNIRIKFD